jgi:hypothetical protein
MNEKSAIACRLTMVIPVQRAQGAPDRIPRPAAKGTYYVQPANFWITQAHPPTWATRWNCGRRGVRTQVHHR